MRRIRIGRPSPAMIVGLLALFMALGSGAYAASQVGSGEIKNNSIKSKDLKNKKGVKGVDVVKNSLKGKQIKESSLGTVPNSAETNRIVPFGPTNLSEGQTATLTSDGPLSVVASCQDDAGATELNVLAASTEAGSAFAGDDNSGPLGPTTLETDRTFEDPGASDAAGGDFATSDGYDDQFWLFAPSGPIVTGTVGSIANGDSQTCVVFGFITVVH
jgi:hypothetical protein